MEKPQVDETLDLLCGRLKLYQARDGYRFGVETLLLAGFVEEPCRFLLDLGCGSGVLAMLLVHLGKADRAAGVEIQPAMADRARRSAELNGLQDRVDIYHHDLRRVEEILKPASFDMVVSNPPHRPAGRGRTSPNIERAVAREEISCTLEDVFAAAARMLRPRGRFVVIYPPDRLQEAFEACKRFGLAPSRLRMVHPKLGEPANHFLLEARRAEKRQLVVEPPLIVHEPDGSYTAEVQRMLYPGGSEG
ncbi:MAG: tRNA1(Val) (adenine(37)-N6)-methyltransferase [Deltaproteobacteria bacterium]|nr:MAG: tRNA1(Val) (adenine(37)-N6)-methyltransferase [Deltaproteobacteria bacterium]